MRAPHRAKATSSCADDTHVAISFDQPSRLPHVGWLRGDVTTYEFDANHYDLWHDRAVFHFLTQPEHGHAYAGS